MPRFRLTPFLAALAATVALASCGGTTPKAAQAHFYNSKSASVSISVSNANPSSWPPDPIKSKNVIRTDQMVTAYNHPGEFQSANRMEKAIMQGRCPRGSSAPAQIGRNYAKFILATPFGI